MPACTALANLMKRLNENEFSSDQAKIEITWTSRGGFCATVVDEKGRANILDSNGVNYLTSGGWASPDIALEKLNEIEAKGYADYIADHPEEANSGPE